MLLGEEEERSPPDVGGGKGRGRGGRKEREEDGKGGGWKGEFCLTAVVWFFEGTPLLQVDLMWLVGGHPVGCTLWST